MGKLDVIGKSHPQLDGYAKVSGKTRFVSDMELPHMLHGRILRSPHPHARIISIDTSRAEELPGVKAVISYKDTPGIKFGPRSEDWTIFADDIARFHGDEVAAVAAIDEDTAEEALELIEVQYEALPGVYDPVEALEEGAVQVHEDKPGNVAAHYKIEAGDVDGALAAADCVYEGSYYLNQVYQAYLEPMGCVAEVDDAGRFNLYAGTQVPNPMRLTYAKALDIGVEMIRVVVPDYGGGFGGKMETNIHLIAMLLARKTDRPVRMMNTRHDDFIAGNPRVPMHIDIKLGATKDGKITGKEVRVVGAAGSRLVYAHAIVSTACYRVDALYDFKNVRAEGFTVYTNTVPTSCYRGFGNSQMTFVLESAMDELAEKLGIDPVQIRLINAIKPYSTNIHGWEIKSCALEECITEAAERIGWEDKRADKTPLRGIGLACCNHVSGNRAFFGPFDGGGGIVRIGMDGRVTVFHGESDMGQGMKTTFAQIVAERLGVSLDRVSTAMVDTDISPFGCGSFATRGTVMGGNGVLAAAADASEKIIKVAARMLEADAADIVCSKDNLHVVGDEGRSVGFAQVAEQATYDNHGAPIVGVGHYDPGTVLPDPKTKKGNISPVYPFGCHIAEVEVDPSTGHVTVTGYVAAHDVGRAINPLSLQGQIQGGVAQGLGWTLYEDMIYRDGKIINPDFVDYVIPTALDMPEVDTIILEPVDPNGPYGAKGIGEPALNPVMSAITNAIFNATGIRIKSLPISPEEIMKQLREMGN